MSELAPYWVDIVKDVEDKVADIETCIEKLHDAHKNRLMVRFNDDADKVRDKEIDQLTKDITRKFSRVTELLKQIESNDGGGDEAVCRNIQRTIASKLQNLSLSFRKSQKQYLSKLKLQKGGKSSVFVDADDEEEDVESGLHLSEAEGMVLGDVKQDLHARDKEIQKIARSIEELTGIFKELAVLVIEQGTILDRIDYNMDMVVDQVDRANDELEKVVKSQKQGRPHKCIIILLIIIFVLLVLLGLKHHQF